ncbi:MAG: bifunctional 4-hydroxy-2-oxoglutarate aldolase/2-dehydro-3-deoxy-phosphogluconate aldolase [Verrucomicrobiota bacterium]
MSRKDVTLGRILKSGLVPVYIHDSLDVVRLAEAAIAAGVHAVEVSCRRPDVVQVVKRLRSEFPDLAVGVASLIEEGAYFDFLQQRGPRFPSIAEAVDAGADFLVSALPFNKETYDRFPDLPIIPGVHSMSEAKTQLDFGASLVKFGNVDGPRAAAINCGPIHLGFPMLVTGGVRPEHVGPLVAAKVLVCVAGFELILRPHYLALQKALEGDVVRACVGEYITAFAAARRSHQPHVDFASGDPRLIQEQTGQFLNIRPDRTLKP